MQAAFSLARAAPPAGPFVFISRHGSGAGSAADAHVATVMERVVGHLVPEDRVPHHGLGPIGQGRDLHHPEFVVPANDCRRRPVVALIPSDPAHPGVESGQHPANDREFAVAAAPVGRGAVERAAMLPLVVLDVRLGPLEGHLDPIPFRDLIPKLERFLKLVAGVEVEHKRGRGKRREPVENQAAFWAEGSGHREPRTKPFCRPGDDLGWRRWFKRPTSSCEFFPKLRSGFEPGGRCGGTFEHGLHMRLLNHYYFGQL